MDTKNISCKLELFLQWNRFILHFSIRLRLLCLDHLYLKTMLLMKVLRNLENSNLYYLSILQSANASSKSIF